VAKKGTRFTSLTDWLNHLKEAGAKGGKKRAENLTPEQQSAIGKKAAEARWGKKRTKKPKRKDG
jgi:uncharacterized heparinase superfamily protein